MSPTVECVGTMPLTVSTLSLPEFQLKDTGRTELFVRAQQRFATAVKLPSCPPTSKSNTAIQTDDKVEMGSDKCDAMQGGGFSSPILKARVDRMPRTASPAKAKRQGSREETKKAREKTISRPAKAESCKHRAATMIRTSKKRPASPDSEHIARLAERRDRMRANRAIMKPAQTQAGFEEVSSSAEQGTKTKQPGRNKKRTKKRNENKKVKLDSALTLMQNFMATNVGKDRLTLKPGPNVGFFNKGKASVPTKTDHEKGKKRKKDFIFSELKFLNSGPPLSHSESDDAISTFSELQHEPSKFFTTDLPLTGTKNNNRKRRRSRSESSHPVKRTVDPTLEDKMDAPNNSRESEIWDIELDKPLPSEGGSEHGSVSKAIVVLDTKSIGWGLKPGLQTVDDQSLPNCSPFRPGTPAVPLQSDTSRHKARSSSLAPSNSASQQINARPLTPPTRTALGAVESTGFEQISRSLSHNRHPSVPHKSFLYRFGPHRNAETYEPPVSPAPDSLLFPPYLNYESGDDYPHEFAQEDQELVLPYFKDVDPHATFNDHQTDDYILEDMDLQPPELPPDAYYSYENFPQDSGFSGKYPLQYAALDSEDIDQVDERRLMNDCLKDETSEYDFCESGERIATGAYEFDDVLGQPLSTEELETMDPNPSLFKDNSESPISQRRLPFTQGRSILMGVEESFPRDLENTEVEVARKLKNHWIPQRL